MPFNPNEPRDYHGRWTVGGLQNVADTLHLNRTFKQEIENTKAQAAGLKTATGKSEVVVIDNADGTRDFRVGGSAAWRNFNPGNLVPSPFSRRHGAIGQDSKRAIFPDVPTGLAAMKAILHNTYGESTIDDTIAKYAKTDPHILRYHNFVHNFTKVSGNTKINALTSEKFESLVTAMRRHEGYEVGFTFTMKK